MPMPPPHPTEPRIGLLGGTFDPVHQGHLSLCRLALDRLVLDSVLLIPAAIPPHKRLAPVTGFSERLAMLALAVCDEPRFMVSDLEAARQGPSYTIDTLAELRATYGPDPEFFFLMGSDSFLDVPNWKRSGDLLDLGHFGVFVRAGCGMDELEAHLARWFPGHGAVPGEMGVWRSPTCRGRIHLIDAEPEPVSSTEVRARAEAGQSLAGLVPELVRRHIETTGLYRRGELPVSRSGPGCSCSRP